MVKMTLDVGRLDSKGSCNAAAVNLKILLSLLESHRLPDTGSIGAYIMHKSEAVTQQLRPRNAHVSRFRVVIEA